jgi:CRP-like cAMP-binding protein
VVGEISRVRARPHSANSTATCPTRAAVFTREAIAGLIRQRPDIGTTLYKNLASQLGERLVGADLRLASQDGE